MSWQRVVVSWGLRRYFRPYTELPNISVNRVRARADKCLWTPRVPAGFRLREGYGSECAPLAGEWLEPEPPAPDCGRPLIVYLHGGGYYFCSPRTHRTITFELAARARAALFALDYRLAPEHPFPAALHDALAAYRALLEWHAPRSIVIAGDSAGGGLALATLVALRDAGELLPAGAVLFSPWTDLAASGASIVSNHGQDPMFAGPVIGRAAKLYLGDASPDHPLVSPVYADLHGLPPLFIQVGSTEVLLDDSVRVAHNARMAGVSTQCRIWSDMPHVWQIYAPFLPEGRRALREAAQFVTRVAA
ncbi:alpha/beta hydrolase [Mycetohabitans endofungorum]|uniref:alpha/beta hydrolase n=1 Tax=Mycetohabitans endofungorum TaxID=417203 RepID=UPI002B05F9DC|nr:alpha/beta hydrolase [Mycetohabitans endofungorum]